MRSNDEAVVAKIAAKLEARGTRLRPPADHKSLGRLESAIGAPLCAQARALFSAFDGFEEQMADDATMICLWSTQLIYQNVLETAAVERGQVIADYFLSAESLRCDLTDAASQVWWHERGKVASDSLFEFCRKVAEGTFAP